MLTQPNYVMQPGDYRNLQNPKIGDSLAHAQTVVPRFSFPPLPLNGYEATMDLAPVYNYKCTLQVQMASELAQQTVIS